MANRRPLIRSPRVRSRFRWIALGLALLAAFTCAVRLAWLWDSAPPAGGVTHNSVRIEHGLLIIERHSLPAALATSAASAATAASAPRAQPDRVIFNRTFDPGIVLDIFSYSFVTIAAPAGPATTVTQQFGIATLALWLALILVVNTMRFIKIPPGQCECGYDLRGITSSKCPECGAAIMS